MITPEKLAQERREECRAAVLEFLAERNAVAHHAQTIRQRLNAGHAHDFTIEEVEAALAFLAGSEPALVKATPTSLGATKYYQATAAGVIAHERGA